MPTTTAAIPPNAHTVIVGNGVRGNSVRGNRTLPPGISLDC